MRPATHDDAAELAVTIRESDRLEVEATSGRGPLAVLLDGLELSSQAWTVLAENQVMCMWGVVDRPSMLGERIGAAWMLTAQCIEQYPKEFYRACKLVLPELLDDYDVLINWIDCRHEKALRWATRLGFQLDEPGPFGIEGRPFCRFEARMEDLNV